MGKNLKEKQADRLVDLSWLTEQRAKGVEVIDGELVSDRIRKTSDTIAKLTAKMAGYDPEEPEDPDLPWEPSFPDRQEVLDLPVWGEFRVHYMGLPGWGYRNLDENPDMVYQQIYEVARRTRISGAKFMRTFLMNGKRSAGERYMMDALPWEMVKEDGVKKVDFSTYNEKYWKVLEIIEQACKYWKIHHQPTFWMDRYNYDIFNRDFNVQGIHGFWEDTTVPVKVDFMKGFLQMQRIQRNKPDYQGTFEFINEPTHGGNHQFGGQIADHHLDLWRGIEDFTVIENAMTCSRGSEFAHANFVEENCEDFNRCFGSDEFASRGIKPEYHGVSTLQTLMDDLGYGIGSAWRWLLYNEDGADDGDYSPIPWTSFRLASASQVFDTMWYGHTECQAHGKKFFFTAFMMDVLRQDKQDNNIAKEELDPEQIEFMNWERPNQYRAMREDLG